MTSKNSKDNETTPENCSTCSLASTATWKDFRNMVLREYLLFRAAGGEAFIGFWIPHTGTSAHGHIEQICPGDFSVILGVEEEECCLSIYRSDDHMTCAYFSWDLPWHRIQWEDSPQDCNPDWVREGEWVAVNLAVDMAITELYKYGVSPVDAFFTSPDWVMHYD
jgi:hypothetical protein